MIKVLLIEDDQLVRSTLTEMLIDLGCAVIEAEDGSLGLSLLQSEDPTLVITDILMPNKEGTETIQEIRAAKPDLPIVAISGGGVSGDLTFLDYAQRLGANHILQKPIDLNDLEACVNALAIGPPGGATSTVGGDAPKEL